VDSSHFSLYFDSILSPKTPKYFILNVLKRSLILAYGQLAADSLEEIECSVLNITLLIGPHFSTVLSLSRSYSIFPLSSGKTLNLN
jgi:hypothetical protein